MTGGGGTRGGFEGLDACVHCGFCLQACPTFLATGDESDSPRGRIELMRALERGDLEVTDTALAYHLDRCLGCRACEPVCPSGVRYGQGLEAARSRIAEAKGTPLLARMALWVLTTPGVSRVAYWFARLLRSVLPRGIAGWGRIRFALGMLAATKAVEGGRGRARVDRPRPPSTALLFRGCVQDGLFRHVHDATKRTMAVNGWEVREITGQGCCGALHAHAGLLDEARALARVNIAAFGDGGEPPPIVVNSAGCGALMKEYGHLVGGAASERFAARVRDVTELLAPAPVPGAPLDLHVAYDPPCHLLHAQGIAVPPLKLFAAIPLLELVQVPGAAECCGSAGLFTLVEPEMSRAVLAPKLARLREAAPQVVATGNPGCLMQLGAGLAAAGLPIAVRHPVELLDDAYRAAGRYE
ncbi:MAG TPA: heterodisulfide reductase-related iron-sulfur binding cluster [Gemmatimonadales bacterium]|nr:heterodisulfide reductase-related iron-sulfur binding cluster [Gemmatimonadales bacterium]